MSGIVEGRRTGVPQPISSIDDSGTERLATDAKFTSGFVAEVNLDRTNDEVTAFGPAGTLSAPSNTTVTVASTAIGLPANTNRVGVIINHHSGTNDVFVGLTTVTATSYIWRIQPGESLVASYGFPTAQINAITSTGTAVVVTTDITGPNP